MLSQKVWRLTSASTLPFPLTTFPTQPTMKELSLNYFWVIRCLLPSQHPCLLSTNLHPTAERVVDTAGERTLKVLEKGEQGEGGVTQAVTEPHSDARATSAHHMLRVAFTPAEAANFKYLLVNNCYI